MFRETDQADSKAAPNRPAAWHRSKSEDRTGQWRRVADPPGRSPRIGPWVVIRIYVTGSILTLLFLAIGYKAYGLQVDKSDKYRRLAQRQHLHTVEIPAPRGPMLDTKGRELAVTASVDSVFANPREILDVADTAETLASILQLDIRAVEAKLTTRRYFVWLERHVTPEQAEMVRHAALPGVYLTPEPRRFYPGMSLAGPVLGVVGIDGNGLDGIELKMDALLSGQQARFAALRDASGRVMIADGLVKPEPGATITLTIDRAIQFIAERALEAAVKDNQARAGTLVILDVATGEVLAMANWPTHNPNLPGRARARNRAVTDAFEIGSVTKVFTIAAALDAGAVDTDEFIDVEGGQLRVGRKLIRDTYRDKALTVGGIIRRSSNVGAVKVARRLGKKPLYQALVRYGFGSPTGIELPGERRGRIRLYKHWGDIELASISYGYGMTATAVQIAAGFAAIGNRGVYLEPRLIGEVRDASDAVIYAHVPAERRIMKSATAAKLLPMLASVFEKGRDGGTARSLDSPAFDVGGKTGTARKVDPETRQYSQELYVSSFAGLAPIDAPRIAVVVVIDEPRGEHYYGGKVAGPAFVRVVDETLRYLGVPPKAEAVQPAGSTPPSGRIAGRPAASHSLPERSAGPAEPRTPPSAIVETGPEERAPHGPAGHSVAPAIVPDFIGLGMTRALDVARRAGIAVDTEGSGRAVEQYPPPGSEVRDTPCLVVFSQTDSSD
ncbi:MAG: PASTA domain-containing protein [Proteobacteria bacterium]|nr:PASTA domain-containing protein [Pseudomonadota bacterium]